MNDNKEMFKKLDCCILESTAFLHVNQRMKKMASLVLHPFQSLKVFLILLVIIPVENVRGQTSNVTNATEFDQDGLFLSKVLPYKVDKSINKQEWIEVIESTISYLNQLFCGCFYIR